MAAVACVSLMLCLILSIVSKVNKNKLPDQQMAARWANGGRYAQISCFIDPNAMIDADTLLFFRHRLNDLIQQDSIVPPNENARLFTDAYCATGNVTASTTRTSVSITAYGVAGDFFRFHPLQFSYGTFFGPDDIMKDYCVIDEETAWNLFGALNVVGMKVEIGGTQHTVVGVIARDKSSLVQQAGLDQPVIYLPYESLTVNGSCRGISCYEIVMPNPITGYAKQKIIDNIGISESDMSIVENSSRFSVMHLFDVLKTYRTRVMRTDSIPYPYWENVARAKENTLAKLLVFRIIFMAIPIVFLVLFLISAYRHRKWHKEDILEGIRTLWEKGKRAVQRLISKKGNKREENYEKEE